MIKKDLLIIFCGLLVSLGGKSDAICPLGSYLNICGICVGGLMGGDELHGLDRCGICNGNSTCVGCDGMVNSTRRRDLCGMCLPPTAEQWNDCRKIESVYPAVLERAFGDQLITLTLSGAGLKNSDLQNAQCHILPEEEQLDGPTVKELSIEDNDIEIKVLVSPTLGKYKIGCSEIEGFAELRIVNSKNWNAVSVSPTKCVVDTPIELELDVQGNQINVGDVWCFVRSSGRDTKTIPATWISDGRVKCETYNPLIPGIMKIGIVATEDAAGDTESTGATVDFSVHGKPPIGETAEYSPDMQQIWIKFDQNIETTSDCSKIFPQNQQPYLGTGFTCSSSGDTLQITLGSHSKILEAIDVTPDNGIRRAGSLNGELSPMAMPISLALSKHKVMSPKLSLTLPSETCSTTAKQPHVDVKISPMGNQKLDYKWSIPPIKEARRSQRENLLMWKSARQLERELNSKAKQPPGAKINSTVLLPHLEYVINVHGSNSLGHEFTKSSSLKISSTASASVSVTSAPSTSAIAAEVNVTFCRDVSAPVRYRWYLNDQIVSEDSKILLVRDLEPGSYNVSCYVLLYNSSELLGAGWTTTQIVPIPSKIIIFPAEIIVGTMDAVTLQAFPPMGMSISWSCKTVREEPCLVAGPRVFAVEQMLPNNSTVLNVPPGLLPVGKYIWSIHNLESTQAFVTISPGIPPEIHVPAVTPGIDPTKAFSISGTVKRLHTDCRIWWSTVRQKGYNFFHLQEDVGLGDLIKILPHELFLEEREVPLTIPSPTGKWEGLMGESSYLLRLQASCPPPTPLAHIDVPVIVNAPPQIPQFSVSPSTGEATHTKFTIPYIEGSDILQDYPLMYHWSYMVGDEEKIDISTGVFPRELSTTLPPGDISIVLKVCDIENACSSVKSNVVKVSQPGTVTSETIADIQFQIESLMAAGDSKEAFGLAITSFKTLAATQQNEELTKLSAATESFVEARIKDLSSRIESDRKLVKVSLEFLEEAIESLNYYPKTNGVVQSLTDFKNRILGAMTTKRQKRDAGSNVPAASLDPNTIQAFLELNVKKLNKNDTEENRQELLNDVRKYMVQICAGSPTVLVVVESSIVAIGAIKLTKPQDIKENIDIFKKNGFKVKLNNRAWNKKCLASAKFSRDLLTNADDGRFSDIYEIQFIRTDTDPPSIVTSTSSSDPQMNLNIPVTIPENSKQDVECRMWNSAMGWSNRCSSKKIKNGFVVCSCKDFGYVAVFKKDLKIVENNATTKAPPTTKTTITTTITMPTTTATPSPETTEITTTSTTTLKTTPTNKTKEYRTGKPQPLIGASFKIDEDYTKTVKNETNFKQSLKSQIAKQLKISESMIVNILIRPGSIIVTVFFLDFEQPAETVVENLVTKIRDGNLLLTKDDDSTPLTVPPQDLKIIVPPPPSKGYGGIRVVAYGVVAGTIALIALFAISASIIKKKRSQLPLRMPKLSIDDTPTYRQFHNELSLDGSSSSLARYRRDPPVNSETSQ